jgi:hypothetical protein
MKECNVVRRGRGFVPRKSVRNAERAIRASRLASDSERAENGGMAFLFRLDFNLRFIFIGLAGT